MNIPRAVGLMMVEAGLLVESIAMTVWSDAKQNHSFKNRTGSLEDSIRYEKVEQTNKMVKWRVLAGNEDVDYAIHVELGTRKMQALPFLRPALERALRKMRRA